MTLVTLNGCMAPTRCVSMDALEQGEPVVPRTVWRTIISDADSLEALRSPLGQRLSLLEIRSPAEWERLRHCAAEIGPAPDFRQGIVVGLMSHTGIPVNGDWPIELDCVIVHEGAGFAVGSFHGGTFLADDTTYVEMTQIRGLRAVLMVDVNGIRYCAK